MNDDDRYSWKDRQLDHDSRRTFEAFAWAAIGGLIVLTMILISL